MIFGNFGTNFDTKEDDVMSILTPSCPFPEIYEVMKPSSTIIEYLKRSSGKAEHYKHKKVPTGYLHIDRAYALSNWLRARENGENTEFPNELKIAPLMPCHSAFAYRFGINKLPENLLLTALTPASYTLATPLETERKWSERGTDLIREVAHHTVIKKFPKLFPESYKLAIDSYLAPLNMYKLGRIFGIDKAIINVLGLHEPIPQNSRELGERIKWLVFPREQKKYPEKRAIDKGALKDVAVSSMLTLIGACLEHFGRERTCSFLEKRLFSGFFDAKLLIRTNSPVIDLSRYLESIGKPSVAFRLIGESGRLSNTSMFLVGAYVEKTTEMIGEGFGASINLAEKRAALDALRNLQLSK